MQIQGQVKQPVEGQSEHSAAAGARLRRSKIALDALHAALRDLSSRLRGDDRDICARAIQRVDELHAVLCELEPAAAPRPVTTRPLGETERDCGIGTVCQAARTSLGKEFEPRVLIALDPMPAEARIEGESAVRSLRRVLRAMFVGGADAVLLHAHVEGNRAVFALLDDRAGFDPAAESYAQDLATTERELAGVGGSISAIETGEDEQRSAHGVVLRLPLQPTGSTGSDPQREGAA